MRRYTGDPDVVPTPKANIRSPSPRPLPTCGQHVGNAPPNSGKYARLHGLGFTVATCWQESDSGVVRLPTSKLWPIRRFKRLKNRDPQ